MRKTKTMGAKPAQVQRDAAVFTQEGEYLTVSKIGKLLSEDIVELASRAAQKGLKISLNNRVLTKLEIPIEKIDTTIILNQTIATRLTIKCKEIGTIRAQGADLMFSEINGARIKELRIEGSDLFHMKLREARIGLLAVDGSTNLSELDLSGATVVKVEGIEKAKGLATIATDIHTRMPLEFADAITKARVGWEGHIHTDGYDELYQTFMKSTSPVVARSVPRPLTPGGHVNRLRKGESPIHSDKMTTRQRVANDAATVLKVVESQRQSLAKKFREMAPHIRG